MADINIVNGFIPSTPRHITAITMSKIRQKLNQEGANLRTTYWSTGAAASLCAIYFVYPFIPSFHQVESTIAVDSSFPRLAWLTERNSTEVDPNLHEAGQVAVIALIGRCVFGTIRVGERNESCDATVLAPGFPCSPIPLLASISTFDLHHLQS